MDPNGKCQIKICDISNLVRNHWALILAQPIGRLRPGKKREAGNLAAALAIQADGGVEYRALDILYVRMQAA